MRIAFITIWLTFICEAKRFVLLDPDDSDIEKSASNITDPEVRTRSMKMAKFRKWLKYDADCDFIPRAEMEKRISQGKCPAESESDKTTTTTTKSPKKSLFFKRKRKPVSNKDRGLFSHQNKESVVRAVVGDNKMHDMDLLPLSEPDLELVSGAMVTFTCDQDAREKKRKKTDEPEFVEWFVNGRRIKPSWHDWRVSVSRDGKLGIWPINEGDSGHFECLVNGQLVASVEVKVVSLSKVLIGGFYNYLLVCAVYIVVIVSLGCLLGSRNQEVSHLQADRMEQFLAENVFKTNEMAKKKVAQIIGEQGKVNEHELIEKQGKGNRSTIMLLLQNPDVKNLARTPQKVRNAVLNKVIGGDKITEKEEGKETELETKTTERETKKTTEKEEKDRKEEEVEEEEEDSEEEEEDDVASSTVSKDSKASKNSENSKDAKTGKTDKTEKSKDSKDKKKEKKEKKKDGKKKGEKKKKGTKNGKKGAAGKGKKKVSKGTKKAKPVGKKKK